MYRIEYESGSVRKSPRSRRRRVLITVILFCVFYLMVYTCFPEDRILLQMLLIPGDPERTLQAVEVFAAELSSGYDISDAVRNFYISVFGNAYSG